MLTLFIRQEIIAETFVSNFTALYLPLTREIGLLQNTLRYFRAGTRFLNSTKLFYTLLTGTVCPKVEYSDQFDAFISSRES